MRWLSEFVDRHKKSIIITFVAVSLVGVLLFLLTPVNYNMMDYLPEDANSTKALNLMQKEFDQPLPNLNVMVENVSLTQALDIKERIAGADYVKEVLWLDDTVNLQTPLQVQDTATVETYYKDGNALYMVSVEDGQERTAIASIRNAIGDCKVSGSAADQATSQDMAVSEAMKAIVLIIPVTILILILVTESWIEPFFYLMNIGTPVLINLGANFFRGEISFVTLAAAPVLQIAVSLDYAIFLSHSFESYKKLGMEPKRAMRFAMTASVNSIGASMLTTLFGFVALLFMNFKIGADMGISLVIGILISFISVMVFFPALLLRGNKLIEKTKHRRLTPTFQNIGKGISKIRIPVFCLILLLMFPAFLGQSHNSYFYGSSEKTVEGSEAWDIEQEFGVTNSAVLLVPRGDSAKEVQMCDALNDLDHITSVTSYATMVSNKIPAVYLDSSIVDQFYSDDYARIILSSDCAYEGDEAFAMVESVQQTAEEYYPDSWYLCGQSANMYDIKTCVQHDNTTVTLITVVSIYLILLLMTRNWLMPIFLILAIECSIGQCFAVGLGKVHTATKVCRFILTKKSFFVDETGAHGKGFLDIFIVRRIISPEHRVTVCVLLPCAEHKAVLFTVGCRQHRISEGGKLSVIGDIGSFHLRCVFVESDIFPHRRDLILNVCNFTAVFIREVLVGVAQILTVVFYPTEGDTVRGHFQPFVTVHLGVVPSFEAFG